MNKALLIFGNTCAGKSTLALRLEKKTGFSYFVFRRP